MKSVERKWALDYVTDETKVIIAEKTNSKWNVSISSKLVSDEWSETDRISLYSFTNYDDISISEEGEIQLVLNDTDYKVGNIATLLIYNCTKDDYKSVYINFSDNDNIVVETEFLRETFAKASDNREIEVRKNSVPKVDFVLPAHVKPMETTKFLDAPTTVQKRKVDASANFAWSSTTNANTFFVAYTAGGTVASEYSQSKSPFEVIQKIVHDEKINYTVRESTNTNTVVFKYEPNVRNKFYCFQFTNFYGCANPTQVLEWTQGYLYTHAVRSDGYFGSNTDVPTDNASNQPYAHSYFYELGNPANGNESRLEGNSGAYVYKFSKKTTTSKFVKATKIVNLSEATIHYDSDHITTFYSYINATSNDNGWFTCDIGLAMSLGANGEMQFVANASEAVQEDFPDDTTIATFSRNGTTFTTNQDVKLYFEVLNGIYHAKAYNYQTGKTIEVRVRNNKIKTTNLVFLDATSFVPYAYRQVGQTKEFILPDIRCGAYVRNIPILYSRLYTSNQDWDGNNTTEFAPNSSSVTDSLIKYDNDHLSYNYYSGNRREVISIDYTNTYEA